MHGTAAPVAQVHPRHGWRNGARAHDEHGGNRAAPLSAGGDARAGSWNGVRDIDLCAANARCLHQTQLPGTD